MCPTKTSPADHKYESGSRHYTTGAGVGYFGVLSAIACSQALQGCSNSEGAGIYPYLMHANCTSCADAWAVGAIFYELRE